MSLFCFNEIYKEPVGPGHAGWQLPKPTESRINVHPFAMAGIQQCAIEGLFTRVVHAQQRRVGGVPARWKVQAGRAVIRQGQDQQGP